MSIKVTIKARAAVKLTQRVEFCGPATREGCWDYYAARYMV